MINFELLQVEPLELQFPFELQKQITCLMKLTNKTDNHVAFKVKTTNPKKYCVRPNNGIVLPHSSSEVTVTMQAQKEAPLDMQCKDKFLLQSVNVSPVASATEITPELFNKGSGNLVEECKLKVVYVPPPQPSSPVREGSEEGASPRTLASFVNVCAPPQTVNVTDNNPVSRAHTEPQNNSLEVKSLVSKLTEEKNSISQQNDKIQKELELLRRESNRNRGGIPLMYVMIVGLIGFIIGYHVWST